jgi:hypothetical protein
MSIQSNINQGLSLMSLLASQTPMATKRRAAKEAEVELGKKAKLDAAETERATADYNIKHKQVQEFERTKKGLPWTKKKGEAQGHILARQTALEAGEYLYDRAPTQELADNIGKYKEEIEEINAKLELDKKNKIQQAKRD